MLPPSLNVSSIEQFYLNSLNKTSSTIPVSIFASLNITTHLDCIIQKINTALDSWLIYLKTNLISNLSTMNFNAKLDSSFTFDFHSLNKYKDFSIEPAPLPEFICFPVHGVVQTHFENTSLSVTPHSTPFEQIMSLVALIESDASIEDIRRLANSIDDDTLNITIDFSGANVLTLAMDSLASCEIILCLLEKLDSHNVNRMSNRIGMNPLMYFRAMGASEEQIESLLQMGAIEINPLNPLQQLLKLISLIQNHAPFELIRLVVNTIDDDTLNSSIDFLGTTALSTAIDSHAPLEVVLYLLNSSNINRASILTNQTPLMYFLQNGAPEEQIELLRELGAIDPIEQPSILHLDRNRTAYNFVYLKKANRDF